MLAVGLLTMSALIFIGIDSAHDAIYGVGYSQRHWWSGF
jgi:hypothetical protein